MQRAMTKVVAQAPANYTKCNTCHAFITPTAAGAYRAVNIAHSSRPFCVLFDCFYIYMYYTHIHTPFAAG
jgi:hypothetical protein